MRRPLQSALTQAPTPQDEPAYNILIVSDLHFGEALGESPSQATPQAPGVGGRDYLKQVARLTREFCKFLGYYLKNRVDGKPWRLIIAGDMIDFIQASLAAPDTAVPQLSRYQMPPIMKPGQPGQPAHEERPAGDLATPEATLARLDRVVAHQRSVFRRLATFVGEGNCLAIIKGNHDVEFHWQEVQDRFVETLGDLYLGSGPRLRPPPAWAAARAGFRSRVTFHPWFYYEKDLIYVEHGNQYDEYCSFEYVLHPVAAAGERLLEMPLSHQALRYFSGLLVDMKTSEVERWGFVDYLRWVFSLKLIDIWRLAVAYSTVVQRLTAERVRRGASPAAAKVHLERLTEPVKRYGIALDKLRKLDALRRAPASRSLFALVQMFYVDRIALLLLNVLVSLVALVAPGSPWIRALVAGGFALTSIAATLVLGRWRKTETPPKLLRVSRRIRDLLRVPLVVFGHSHTPVAASLGDPGSEGRGEPQSWYFNTGSWSQGAKEGLTHLCVIAKSARPSASLLRWDVKARAPRPVAPVATG